MLGPSRRGSRSAGPRRSAAGATAVAAGLLSAGASTGLVLGLTAGLMVGPAAAAERTVTVTAEGVRPQVLTVAPGDTVRFVVEDTTFAYRAQSTGGDWRFDSGPTALLSGSFTVPSALTVTGTYSYRVAQDPPYAGTVVVTDGGRPAPSSTPVTGASPAPPPRPPTAAPSAPVTPSAVPSAGPAPDGLRPPPAGPASLAQPTTVRSLGLPAALALVLVLGTGGLLVRALLAEPVLSDPRASLRAGQGLGPRW